MNSLTYLTTFFEEKNLPEIQWTIPGDSGPNILTNKVVIEHILNSTEKDQNGIANIVREIDFKNGDVNHFLKFLAQAIVI